MNFTQFDYQMCHDNLSRGGEVMCTRLIRATSDDL